MKAIRQFLFRQAERRLKKVPPLFRGQARFNLHYPNRGYSIGVGSYGLPEIHDWKEGSILNIGAFCSIAAQVQIFLGGHHHVNWATTYPFSDMLPSIPGIPKSGFSRGDVVVGNDVWICTGAMILSGVTIGDGAVIGAGAVVTHDVEPYSIVAGNPAEHIRWRFDDETRVKLRETRWWEWPVEELEQLAPLLCSDRIEDLLAYAAQRK